MNSQDQDPGNHQLTETLLILIEDNNKGIATLGISNMEITSSRRREDLSDLEDQKILVNHKGNISTITKQDNSKETTWEERDLKIIEIQSNIMTLKKKRINI